MCVSKARRNIRQVIIFRCLVCNQDFGKWKRSSLEILKKLLDECDGSRDADDEGCCGGSWLCSCGGSFLRRFWPNATAASEEGTGGPVRATLSNADKLRYRFKKLMVDPKDGKDLRFDLKKADDARDWWTLRNHLLIDLMDESAVMEHYSATIMLLLSIFLLLGFVDVTVHKGETVSLMTAAKLLWQAQGFLAAAEAVAPLAGIVTITTCILTFFVVFVQLVQCCIYINDLLERDAKILLETAAEVSFLRDAEQGTAATSPECLSVLALNAEKNDARQTLFGVPITQTLRNAVLAIVGAIVVNEVWSISQPVLVNLDLQTINEWF